MAVLSLSTVEKLHAVALDATLWPETLAEVADGVGAQGAMVHAMAPDPCDSVLHVARLDPDCDRLYLRHYQVNPMSTLLRRRRPGEILPAMSPCREQLHGTAFHADVLAPQGIEEVTNLLYGDWPNVLTGGYGFCLNARGAEATALHLRHLAEIAPQLTHALDLARHFAGAVRRNWSSLLDTLGTPALLTDYDGRVILANAGGETLLRRGHWLRLRSGRVCAAQASEQVKLAATIREAALAPVIQRRRGRLSLQSGDGQPPCIVVVGAAPAIPITEVGLPRPAVLLIIRDSSQSIDVALLRDIFALTDAEARITAHIIAGRPLRAAAEREGMAHSTARTHLQSVFGKVGVNSQSALASLLAHLPKSG